MTRAEFIEIIERLQNGDRSALENVYNEMYSSLVMVAYRITHNRQDAHDIASDTILKLVDFKGNAHEIQNPIGYLVAATKNAAINFLKKRSHEISVPEVRPTAPEEYEDTLWMEDIVHLLTDGEWKIFIGYFICKETLISLAQKYHYSYVTVKRYKKSIKEKINREYKKSKEL